MQLLNEWPSEWSKLRFEQLLTEVTEWPRKRNGGHCSGSVLSSKHDSRDIVNTRTCADLSNTGNNGYN
eukprot:1244469-Amphidinium_carterae.1